MRVVVLIAIAILIVYVARQAWMSFVQVRMGAVPNDVDVVEVTMVPDRGWQVTRSVSKGTAIVNVEHPEHGIRKSWTIRLREPGAVTQLDDAMHHAGELVHRLSTT